MDSRLELLRKALADAVGEMSTEQLIWHPPGKWCAAEVLEHLYLTYTGTIKGFERVLDAGKPLVTITTVQQRWGTWVVVGFGHLPTGRKAPKMTEPRGFLPEKVRDEMEAKIAAMDEIIARCEEQMGCGVKVLDHPILGPLTAAQWRKFHRVHGRHHAKQIRRLREQSTVTAR
jgi:Protein of unknown function (DUF1569)